MHQPLEYLINECLNRQIDKAASMAGNALVDPDNSLKKIIKSGSRGSKINTIQTMIGLFQQNISGSRLSKGYEGRVNSSFPKFQSDPDHRGFITRGYSQGLTTTQFTQHAMAGRFGMISTSVKTSETGYMQRRLMKAMENVVISDSLTVRDNRNSVIQFSYGGNGFHPSFETDQPVWCSQVSTEAMCNRVVACLPKRERATAVMGAKSQVESFKGLQKIDYFETLDVVEEELRQLLSVRSWLRGCTPPLTKMKTGVNIPWLLSSMLPADQPSHSAYLNATLRTQFVEHVRSVLSTDPSIGMAQCQGLEALVLQNTLWSDVQLYDIQHLWERVTQEFNAAVCDPGSPVGSWTAFSVCAPCTQLTLNTFHAAGNRSGSLGLNRLKEIINMSRTTACPITTIFLRPEWAADARMAKEAKLELESVYLSSICTATEVVVQSLDSMDERDKQWAEVWMLMREEITESYGPFTVRLSLSLDRVNELGVCAEQICEKIQEAFPSTLALGVDLPQECIIIVFEQCTCVDEATLLENNVLTKTSVKGVDGISNIVLEKRTRTVAIADEEVQEEQEFVLVAEGNNFLSVCAHPCVDASRTFSNDVYLISQLLGVEAARNTIENEMDVQLGGMKVNRKHVELLADSMTYLGTVTAVTRFGINRGKGGDNRSTLCKAVFEETADVFSESAVHSNRDVLKSNVTDAIFFGSRINVGTGHGDVIIDADMLQKYCCDEIQSYHNSKQIWDGLPERLPEGGWDNVRSKEVDVMIPDELQVILSAPDVNAPQVSQVPQEILDFLSKIDVF